MTKKSKLVISAILILVMVFSFGVVATAATSGHTHDDLPTPRCPHPPQYRYTLVETTKCTLHSASRGCYWANIMEICDVCTATLSERTEHRG